MSPHLLRLSARHHKVLSGLVRHDCLFIYVTFEEACSPSPRKPFRHRDSTAHANACSDRSWADLGLVQCSGRFARPRAP